MRNIIEELFGRTDGQIDMQKLGEFVDEFVNSHTYNEMLIRLGGGNITCRDVVDWYKIRLGDSLSFPGLQFSHVEFPFFHPAESFFAPRKQVVFRTGDLIHRGQDTLCLRYPGVESMVVADVALPLFGGVLEDYSVIVGDMTLVRDTLEERYRYVLNDERLYLGPGIISERGYVTRWS